MKNSTPLHEQNILYICIATRQNTINILPLQLFSPSKVDVIILASTQMSEKSANKSSNAGRLKVYFDTIANVRSSKIIPYPDGSAAGSAPFDFLRSLPLFHIIDQALDLYLTPPVVKKIDRLVFNYGGGQKYLFPVLDMMIKKRQELADIPKVLIYPEKRNNLISITHFDSAGNIADENLVPVNYPIEVEDLISLYRDDFLISSNCIFHNTDQRKVNNNTVALIKRIPDMYQHDDTARLLFESQRLTAPDEKSGPRPVDITINDFLTTFKAKEKKASARLYKNRISDYITDSLRNKYNVSDLITISNDNNQISITPKNKRSCIPKHSLEVVINFLKASITKPKFWYSVLGDFSKNIPFHTGSMSADLQSFLQPIVKDLKSSVLELNRHTLNAIFSLKYGALFPPDKISHGFYFEIMVVKNVLEYLEKREDHNIHSIHWNLTLTDKKKDTGVTQDYVEFDLVLITKQADIHIIECKTFDFPKENLVQSRTKARQLTSVFTQYYACFPFHQSMKGEYNTDHKYKSRMQTFGLHRLQVINGIETDASKEILVGGHNIISLAQLLSKIS